MGRLRLHTLTTLLTSSQNQAEAIKQGYVTKKLEKLQAKHKDLSQEDLFCIRKATYSTLQARYDDAVVLKNRHFCDEAPEKAVVDAAKASDDLGKILQSIVVFESSMSYNESTKAFEKIIHILAANPDTFVHAAATQALIRLEKSAKNANELHKLIARPLAIAIGMPFNGLPTCAKHREKIEHFVDAHFCGQLKNLGSAVKEELSVKKRFKTSAMMGALRIKRTAGVAH